MRETHPTRRIALKTLGLAVAATAGAGAGSAAGGAHDDRDVDVSDLWIAHLRPQEDHQTPAHGVAAFQYRDDELTFVLTVAHLEDAFMAHVHEDEELGPIAVWLHDVETQDEELVEGSFTGILDAGTITDEVVAEGSVPDAESDTVADLVEKIEAGEAYVNVHTEENPSGEIAGRIEPFEWGEHHVM